MVILFFGSRLVTTFFISDSVLMGSPRILSCHNMKLAWLVFVLCFALQGFFFGREMFESTLALWNTKKLKNKKRPKNIRFYGSMT